MKICIRKELCVVGNIEQPLDNFYKNKGMLDGHAGRCKECSKKEVKENTEKNKLTNPNYVEEERLRGRDKYDRLCSDGRDKKPTYEQKKETIQRYHDKFPEIRKAHLATINMKCEVKGNNLHHWSYNDEHLQDVIELTVKQHKTAHRFLVYNQEAKMYETLNGVLLKTKEIHELYITQYIY